MPSRVILKASCLFFNSTDEKQARCDRLRESFQDPMTEIHLLFYRSTLITFTHLNLLFQRQDPCVYLLHEQIRLFVKKLLSKFLKPGAFRGVNVDTVDLRDEESQLPNSQLGVGFTTRTTLNRLVEAGDVSMDSAKNFHLAARSFFVKAVEYATAKLSSLYDPVLEHSRFVDFRQKMDTTLDDVLYFVHREQDQLNDEFLEFLSGGKQSSGQMRMGSTTGWVYLGNLKNRASGTFKFPKLFKVAQIVLSMPHSNADAERTFSLIGLNKTDTRNRLSLEGTLSSIMTMKMSSLEPCFRYEPPAEVVKQAKTATVAYNRPNL